MKVAGPHTPVKAAETLETTGQSYEQELKKAIQARTQKDSLFDGFFTSRKVDISRSDEVDVAHQKIASSGVKPH